eukprot:963246-Prymnesium_polylepis.1
MSLQPWQMVASTERGLERRLLDARQIMGLLLHLCTASRAISELYESFSTHGQMSLPEWCTFVRSEQLSLSGDDHDNVYLYFDHEQTALAEAEAQFESASNTKDALHVDASMSLLQFSLQLLDRNDA